jgi:2-oxoglutarate ferredoxin oxidoreductase subunit beta
MAPTTLFQQRTTTTPLGRDRQRDGYPLKISEMLAVLEGVVYIERVCVSSPKNVLLTKAAIKQAFQNQIAQRGFSLVEVLSPCPTYWHLSPLEACQWIEQEMTKTFPLGRIK